MTEENELEILFKEIDKLEKISVKDTEEMLRLASCYMQLAELSANQEQFQKFLDLSHQELIKIKDLSDPVFSFMWHFLIGRVEFINGRYAIAIGYLKDSQELFGKMPTKDQSILLSEQVKEMLTFAETAQHFLTKPQAQPPKYYEASSLIHSFLSEDSPRLSDNVQLYLERLRQEPLITLKTIHELGREHLNSSNEGIMASYQKDMLLLEQAEQEKALQEELDQDYDDYQSFRPLGNMPKIFSDQNNNPEQFATTTDRIAKLYPEFIKFAQDPTNQEYSPTSDLVENQEKDEKYLKLVITYQNEDFPVIIIETPNRFDIKYNIPISLAPQEAKEFAKCPVCLSCLMFTHHNAFKLFKLQLIILNALNPQALGIYDESAERYFNRDFIKYSVSLKSNIAPNHLYSIQSVQADPEHVWIHTHGLTRFKRPELEFVNIATKDIAFYSNVLKATACRLIYDNTTYRPFDPFLLGTLNNDQEDLVATLVPWYRAMDKLPPNCLGGILDRIDGHNLESCLIFAYPNDKSIKKKEIYPLSIYQSYFDADNSFLIPDEETLRMQHLGQETLNFVQKFYLNTQKQKLKQNFQILFKVGLNMDSKFLNGSGEEVERKEYIWCELLDYITKEQIRVRLRNQPCFIENIQKDQLLTIDQKQIIDWVVKSKDPQQIVTPDQAYLLDRL